MGTQNPTSSNAPRIHMLLISGPWIGIRLTIFPTPISVGVPSFNSFTSTRAGILVRIYCSNFLHRFHTHTVEKYTRFNCCARILAILVFNRRGKFIGTYRYRDSKNSFVLRSLFHREITRFKCYARSLNLFASLRKFRTYVSIFRRLQCLITSLLNSQLHKDVTASRTLRNYMIILQRPHFLLRARLA